jgi:hypothetical protein
MCMIYACESCGYGYQMKGDFVVPKHLLTHSNNRPLSTSQALVQYARQHCEVVQFKLRKVTRALIR